MLARRLAVAAALLLFAPPLAARQADSGLFAIAPLPPLAIPINQAVVRSRLVTIDAPRLARLGAPGPVAADAAALVLNLFPDQQLSARIDRVEPTASGYLLRGQIAGAADSSVALAVVNGIIAGKVAAADALYTITHIANGVHVIQQVAQTQLPPELPPVVLPAGLANDTAPGILSDDGSTIDVLIAYTPAARNLQGGTSSMQALIDLGVSETNQAYADSGVTQRLHLVHSVEVAYTEAPDMGTDLDRLRATSDGHMDIVHTLRNTYGADLVQLLANSPGSCGIAGMMTSQGAGFASLAFSVAHYTCVSPNYSFAHEMGHNMGLHHDSYVTGASSGTYPYSRGYVNQAAFAPGAATNKRWRDIMAYNDQCAASGFTCTRLRRFSNPSNVNTGDPMGHAATADAARSLNQTAVTVANFRASTSRTISIDDVTMTEGHSGTSTATFTVTLSAATTVPITVNYATENVTASSASDYVAASGVVTFTPGQSSQPVGITINGDSTIEPSETFRVNLSSPSGGTIADGIGIGTIQTDDTVPFTDPSLTVGGTLVKAIHITELRTRIDAVRTARGLLAYAWTDPSLAAIAIKAVHITEMRTALGEAYAAAMQTAPSYTDSSLSGVTIKAVHILELRAAVTALE
jgi:peptidyl-Asp metalloendopeptidase